jgi:hypothetical protein
VGVAEVRRLKQLEDENAKLKRLVADLSMDMAILQDVLRKKSGAWPAPWAGRVRTRRRRSCGSCWCGSGSGRARDRASYCFLLVASFRTCVFLR